jgi:chromosome segregation ATPase
VKLQCLQERDGYKKQMETLRNKISELARNLADRDDAACGTANDARQMQASLQVLEQELSRSQELSAELKSSLAAAERDLVDVRAELLASREDVSAALSTLSEEQGRVAEVSIEIAGCRKEAAEAAAQVTDLSAKLECTRRHAEEVQETLTALEAAFMAEQHAHKELQETVKHERGTWRHERAQLVSDRDGFKGQVATLRDKVSQLAQQLAVGAEDRQSKEQRVCELRELETLRKEVMEPSEMCRRELDESTQEQDQAADRNVALTDQVALLQATARQLTQRASDATEVARTKAQLVSELETRSLALETALADAQGALKREHAVWRHERTQLASERDGFKGQVDTLRDKISQLAQQLACGSGKGQVSRIVELEAELLAAKVTCEGQLREQSRIGKELEECLKANAGFQVRCKDLAVDPVTAGV